MLRDLSDATVFKSINDYVLSLDEDIKTDAFEYERRLGICSSCDNLLNGMCRICGCFVEARAAKKEQYCPSVDRNW